MALVINSNIASLNAQRNLASSTRALSKSYQRLSSGLRINTASDDAAGLAISQRMTAQINGLNQAVSNANDAISVIQIGDGALSQTTDNLQRMRELAVQAANDTNVTSDRTDLQKEINQLALEISRIANTSQFNNQNLLSGGVAGGITFQVGANQNQTITVSIGAMGASALGVDTMNMASFTMGTTQSANQAAAESAISKIDHAIDSVTSMRATLGAMQNRFEAVVSNLSNISLNTSTARSRIMDADIAAETANMTQNNIMQQAGTAVLAQANQQPALILKLLQ
ncbi:MAG: flagellin FliC [Magnetococcales bacterium]|nr:flagellin FliC [Magnetococcales bacterium]